MKHLLPTLLLTLLFAEPNLAADAKAKETPEKPKTSAKESPVSADKSVELIVPHPTCRVELVAAEPLVIDPIEIRFDDRGRMWVVEMRDYPEGPAPGAPARSRIRILEDKDGNGQFETATTFADGLAFVTGLQPWRNGVIVTLAGKVDYMRDTTGDGKADQVETWYTGFSEDNTQLRANHPRLALDNHIYIANGLRAGAVRDARMPKAKPHPLRGLDFRFDPLTRTFGTVSGNGQFGMAFDNWGNRFVCSNRNPMRQIVLEDRYTARNRRVRISETLVDVMADGNRSRIFPLVDAWTTSNLHAGQFTAACAVTVYRGNALPAEFVGNGFTCDPTGSLIHREQLNWHGAAYRGTPAREGVEFLASKDPWFRAVNLTVGPDGALYVADMYRAVIEHPRWVPKELKNRPDQLWGNDRGRIYRVSAKESVQQKNHLPLGEKSSEELARLLEHANVWHRETAARLLLERQDKAPVPELNRLAAQSKAPVGRLRALWALDGLGSLTNAQIRTALADAHPGVRRQAAVLAESRLKEDPALRAELVRLSKDSHAYVRYQAALSLAPIANESEVGALEQIALAGPDDPWTRKAVVLAAGSFTGQLAARVLNRIADSKQEKNAGKQALVADLISALDAKQQKQITQHILPALLDVATRPASADVGRTGLTQLASVVRRGGSSLAKLAGEAKEPQLAVRLKDYSDATQRQALDGQAPRERRRAAIEYLVHYSPALPALVGLAREEPDADIRRAAIEALARSDEEELWSDLLDDFRRATPPVRRAILSGTLSRENRTALLLDRLESKDIRPAEIDRDLVDRLVKHRNATLRERAKKVMAAAIPADRVKVLQEYQTALKLRGDAARGREHFKKTCAKCHRIGEVGVNVAPDISDSRTKTPAALLTDILQPNRAIDANYISYSIITDDGRAMNGVLANETASSITLRQAEGKNVTLSKDEIDEMRSTGVSLMPEGLERDLPPQAMADVLAFIKGWRYLDGRVPVGK